MVVPKSKDRQVAVMKGLLERTITVDGLDPTEPVLEEIGDTKVGVYLRAKQPLAIDLCSCPTLESEAKRRKRYKGRRH